MGLLFGQFKTTHPDRLTKQKAQWLKNIL